MASLHSTANWERMGQPQTLLEKAGLRSVIRLSAAAEPDKIVGSVDGSDRSSSIFADRAVFNSKTNKTSLAGNYTLRLPGSDGDSTLPTGDGWALIKVSTAGVAKMAGVLGDNTKVTSTRGDWLRWNLACVCQLVWRQRINSWMAEFRARGH